MIAPLKRRSLSSRHLRRSWREINLGILSSWRSQFSSPPKPCSWCERIYSVSSDGKNLALPEMSKEPLNSMKTWHKNADDSLESPVDEFVPTPMLFRSVLLLSLSPFCVNFLFISFILFFLSFLLLQTRHLSILDDI